MPTIKIPRRLIPFNLYILHSGSETITYQEKWNGLCYDEQLTSEFTTKLNNVTPLECEEKCTTMSACIGYVFHANGNCIITPSTKTISRWSDPSSYQGYTCYEKIEGMFPIFTKYGYLQKILSMCTF